MRSELAGLRVLVIEDESMVNLLLQDMLEDAGCSVVGSAFRLKEAVEKAKALSFDLAILDVNLNGERSFPVAELLSERGVSCIFVTGYGSASLPPSLRTIPVLQKPFLQADLERAMRAAL
jgi:DNA-binding response OmpR family regulator